MNASILIPDFTYGKRLFTFKKPFKLDYCYCSTDNNNYHCHDNDLGLLSSGDTLEEFLDCVKEELVVTWDHYVKCNEDQLTEDALWLRFNLISYLRVTNIE